MTAAWTIHLGVGPEQARAAARLYWRSFGRDLQPLPLSLRRGAALAQALMQPGHALVAVTPAGGVLGIAGLRDAKGGFLRMHHKGFTDALGPLEGRARYGAAGLWIGGAAASDLILDGVAVRRGWRGRGLAHALIAAAGTEARRLGYPALRAEVAAGNLQALAAWQAMGFRITGRQRLGWPWCGPAHVLRLPVTP